jgi:hypothetical protein
MIRQPAVPYSETGYPLPLSTKHYYLIKKSTVAIFSRFRYSKDKLSAKHYLIKKVHLQYSAGREWRASETEAAHSVSQSSIVSWKAK